MKKSVAIILGAMLSFATAAHAGDTNCEATGVDKVLANEYSRATHAWCQNNSKAIYMLASLLKAISEGKAQFHGGSGDLIEASGFTAIALGGFKLDSGMIHRRDGKKYISVHFTNTDDEGNTSVKHYQQATYQGECPRNR
jgi:hypothetical protein